MKPTEQLNLNRKELARKISILVDEFGKENGFCELEINIEYYYTERQDGTKLLTGRNLSIDIKI